MKMLWIHYGVLDDERGHRDHRFAVFETTPDGRQVVVSPAGRIQKSADVIDLLVSRGAPLDEARNRVAHAALTGIAHLSVGRAERGGTNNA